MENVFYVFGSGWSGILTETDDEFPIRLDWQQQANPAGFDVGVMFFRNSEVAEQYIDELDIQFAEPEKLLTLKEFGHAIREAEGEDNGKRIANR